MTAEQQALTAYVMVARDWCDFLDFVNEDMTPDGKKLLKEMLTTPNPKHDADTLALNAMAAGLINARLR